MTREEISSRCNTIEECYEFMLAYAGQGLSGREQNQTGAQLREFLGHASQALNGLGDALSAAVKNDHLQPADRYLAFCTVLDLSLIHI